MSGRTTQGPQCASPVIHDFADGIEPPDWYWGNHRPSNRDPQELDDPVLDGMKKRGEPITREYYIRHNWFPVPDPWTVEYAAALPEFLQDHKRLLELKP